MTELVRFMNPTDLRNVNIGLETVMASMNSVIHELTGSNI